MNHRSALSPTKMPEDRQFYKEVARNEYVPATDEEIEEGLMWEEIIHYYDVMRAPSVVNETMNDDSSDEFLRIIGEIIQKMKDACDHEVFYDYVSFIYDERCCLRCGTVIELL